MAAFAGSAPYSRAPAKLIRVNEDGSFWCWYLSGNEDVPAILCSLEDRLADYFAVKSRDTGEQHPLSEGVACLVERQPGSWARGHINKRLRGASCYYNEVVLYDYGLTVTVSREESILPLPEEFKDYPPPVATQFRFSNIIPRTENTRRLKWCLDVMDLVKELSANQRVLIRRLVTDQIVDKVEEVQVYSAAGPQYCINDVLVERGMATIMSPTHPPVGGVSPSRDSTSPQHTVKVPTHPSQPSQGREMPVSTEERDPSLVIESSHPLSPITSLAELSLPRHMTSKLAEVVELSPFFRHISSYMLEEWDVLAVGDSSLGYNLLPLISRLMKTATNSKTSTARVDGPPMIVLCWNSNRVNQIHNFISELMGSCLAHERLKSVCCYGGLEAEIPILLLNGCDVLVATPPSLQRVLTKRQSTLLNLSLLVFDDASTLVEKCSTEIKMIMRHYAESMKWDKPLLQIVAMTTQCTPDVLSLMETYSKTDFKSYNTVISCGLESMIWQKTALEVSNVCGSGSKLEEIKQLALNQSPDTVMVTCVSCDSELLDVKRYCQRYSIPVFCIADDKDVTTCKSIQSNFQHFVVLDNVQHQNVINFRVIHCLIHFSLPPTMTAFKRRLALLHPTYQMEVKPIVKVYLDGSTLQQRNSIRKILSRLGQSVPDFLNVNTQEFDKTKSNDCQHYDLCYFFCAFGECKAKSCRNVHSLNKLVSVEGQIPFYPLPDSGTIKFKVCHIGNGNRMWIRILQHKPQNRGDSPFIPPQTDDIITLTSELTQYFPTATEQSHLKRPKPGDYCVYIDIDGAYHRAQIYSFDRETNEYFHHIERAMVRLLDRGQSVIVDVNQLFELPPCFKSYPRQVVESYVCKVKPNDQDTDFSPQALAFIQEKYEGAELWGRVALAHSGVLWLESVEERVFLKDLRLHTSLSNWRKQFLTHKLGEDNPDHLKKLMATLESSSAASLAPQYPDRYVTLEGEVEYEVLLGGVSDTEMFHVHLLTSQNLLDTIFDMLNDKDQLVGSFGSLKVKVGDLVAAVFPKDNYWYRGKVVQTGSSGRQCLVYFVDFGEEEWINEAMVQPLSPDLWEIPFQAICCSLDNLYLTPVLAEEGGRKLEELAEFTHFTLKVVSCHFTDDKQPMYKVKLYDHYGRDFAELLKKDSHFDIGGITMETVEMPFPDGGSVLCSALQDKVNILQLLSVHTKIVAEKSQFQVSEMELEWVISSIHRFPIDVIHFVMNIITTLVYTNHASISCLTRNPSLEALQRLIQSGREELNIIIISLVYHLVSDELSCCIANLFSSRCLFSSSWVKTLSHLLASSSSSVQLLNPVLSLLSLIVRGDPTLIPCVISGGCVVAGTALLTTLPDKDVQFTALHFLYSILESEMGSDLAASTAVTKAVTVTMATSKDTATLLLALTVAKRLLEMKNHHIRALLFDELVNLSTFDDQIKMAARSLMEEMEELRGDLSESSPIPIPKPVPVCNSDSSVKTEVHPYVLWSQTSTHLSLKLQITSCSEIRIFYNINSVQFSGVSREVTYTMELVLQDHIVPEKCHHRVSDRQVHIELKKRVKSRWPRAVSLEHKVTFVRPDFDQLNLSDETSDSDQGEGDLPPSESESFNVANIKGSPRPAPIYDHHSNHSSDTDSSTSSVYDCDLCWSDNEEDII